MALVQHLLQRMASQQLTKKEKKFAYERLPSLNNDFFFLLAALMSLLDFYYTTTKMEHRHFFQVEFLPNPFSR